MIFIDNKPYYMNDQRIPVSPDYYLRLKRAETGLSQTNYAERLGVSVHSLRAWEQGKTEPSALCIAALLADDSTFWFDNGAFRTSTTDIPMRYGVRALRHLLRQSRYQFASSLGVSPVTVEIWEQGRHEPSPFNLLKIAQLAEETC